MKGIIIDFVLTVIAISILLAATYAVSKNPLWGWSHPTETENIAATEKNEKPLIEEISNGLLFGF